MDNIADERKRLVSLNERLDALQQEIISLGNRIELEEQQLRTVAYADRIVNECRIGQLRVQETTLLISRNQLNDQILVCMKQICFLTGAPQSSGETALNDEIVILEAKVAAYDDKIASLENELEKSQEKLRQAPETDVAALREEIAQICKRLSDANARALEKERRLNELKQTRARNLQAAGTKIVQYDRRRLGGA